MVLALALVSHAAHADGVISEHGVVILAAPQDHEPRAEPTDLARALSGLAFGVTTVAAGAHASSGAGIAGALAFAAVSGVYPFGGFTLGRARAGYASDRTTIRLGMTLAEIEALFVCRDRAGYLHLPMLGQTRYACSPEERFGLAGTVGELAWDPRSARVAARWGELLAVLNLAGGPSSMAYLAGHVDLAVGLGAESVWHGHDEVRSGSDHLARGVARITSTIRSASARWDASLTLAARPAIVGTVRALHDVGMLGEGRVRYNVLVGASSVISIGVLVRAAYWSDPSTSNLALDPVTSTTSLFAGLVVERRHESAR
jgi:hypothetical protein